LQTTFSINYESSIKTIHNFEAFIIAVKLFIFSDVIPCLFYLKERENR